MVHSQRSSPGGAATWVMTIAHRRAIDRVRSTMAAAGREQRTAEVPTPHDEVAEAVEASLDRERVRRTPFAAAVSYSRVASARKAIVAVKDDQLTQPWSLLKAGTPLFTMPRGMMIRNFVLNHLIHHRAILCVYLRLNDISVPGMYDPSGDE